MTSGAVTIENAPRDVEKLQVIGPFMLKRLMEQASQKLGVDFGEERKGAFLRDPIDKRAKDVLELLTQIDKAGGAPAPAAAAPAAAPAEAKAEEKPKREPVTRKTNGATAPAAASTQSEVDAIAILQGIASVIQGVSGSIDAMHKTVASVEKGSKRIDNLEAQLEKVLRMQHVTMAVLSALAENQLGANFKEILDGATGDYENHEKAIEALVSGK